MAFWASCGLAQGVTGYVAMGFGWTAALGLGSALALLSAIVMYLTAPKSTSKQLIPKRHSSS
jgi:hypothetical protein